MNIEGLVIKNNFSLIQTGSFLWQNYDFKYFSTECNSFFDAPSTSCNDVSSSKKELQVFFIQLLLSPQNALFLFSVFCLIFLKICSFWSALFCGLYHWINHPNGRPKEFDTLHWLRGSALVCPTAHRSGPFIRRHSCSTEALRLHPNATAPTSRTTLSVLFILSRGKFHFLLHYYLNT